MSMSLRLLAVSAAFAFAGATFAATPPAATTATAKPHTAQQQRMVDCNKQASGKKGAERKTFMSTCLKGASKAAAATPAAATAGAPAAKQAQQEKMKTCNADARAKALKGAERKAFMSSCLKGGAPATP
ncbi:PsiF family protein [Rhodanobacter umsongensis]|uniref:PsiF family protein n=1 Tax=Rhodanobacter umsongensis TaxID=633153 RepID=A0ABW0JIZ3_9GAMM